MRAVAVRQFKDPPAPMDLPDPVAGVGELVVRLGAAGMNPFDAKIADGIFAGHRPHVFPLVLGVDGAGTVEAVGSGVRRFRVGDRLFGSFLHDPVGRGTYAEAVVIPEGQAVTRLPDGVDPIVGAALPTAGMTAVEALERLNVRPGGRLLIVGASGGVGAFAVPLAVAGGAQVIAVGRPDAQARLRRIGASDVVDPASVDLVDRLRSVAPTGFEGLLDLASDGPRFAALAGLVRPGATAATTTFVADPKTAPTGVTVVNLNMQPRSALLDRLAAEVAAGRVPSPVERVVSLEDAPTALAEIRAGRGAGKTVVRTRPSGAVGPL